MMTKASNLMAERPDPATGAAQPYGAPATRDNAGQAIAALICGLLSVPLSIIVPPLGTVLAIVAIVLGVMAAD
jgi:hypothetical protein